jgi:hypothetical protein
VLDGLRRRVTASVADDIDPSREWC